uniref:Uncharacterized protein n=1 Tax=Nothoprocta perdicaria TaxID=30464 RepID=A0A8C6ZFF8_NOTPE
MRCVLIASAAAELLFYWADAAFARRLRAGAAGQHAPALEDSLNTLFAPLIISCTALLEKLSDTYTCFTTEPGSHLHVLHMVGPAAQGALGGHRGVPAPLAPLPEPAPSLSPAQGAAGAGQREAAALLPVSPALPDLGQPEPVPGPAGPCPEADEVGAGAAATSVAALGAALGAASHCSSSRQGEAAGLEGFSAGEEQAQYHHGVISVPEPGGLGAQPWGETPSREGRGGSRKALSSWCRARGSEVEWAEVVSTA